MPIQIFIGGGADMEKCFDCLGIEINEGDVLTSDYYADYKHHSFFNPELTKEEISERHGKPLFLVKKHKKGYLYANSLHFVRNYLTNEKTDKRLYLHNFRFSTTKRLGDISDFKHLLEE